jgi:hypothetical protein
MRAATGRFGRCLPVALVSRQKRTDRKVSPEGKIYELKMADSRAPGLAGLRALQVAGLRMESVAGLIGIRRYVWRKKITYRGIDPRTLMCVKRRDDHDSPELRSFHSSACKKRLTSSALCQRPEFTPAGVASHATAR